MIRSFDCLKAEVFAVPQKRPFLLKNIQHPQVSLVAVVSGSDREFDAVDHDRKRGTSFLRLGEKPRNDFDECRFPICSLPTECLRRNLDERNQVTLIQISRQRRKVWEAYTKGLNFIAVIRRNS